MYTCASIWAKVATTMRITEVVAYQGTVLRTQRHWRTSPLTCESAKAKVATTMHTASVVVYQGINQAQQQEQRCLGAPDSTYEHEVRGVGVLVIVTPFLHILYIIIWDTPSKLTHNVLRKSPELVIVLLQLVAATAGTLVLQVGAFQYGRAWLPAFRNHKRRIQGCRRSRSAQHLHPTAQLTICHAPWLRLHRTHGKKWTIAPELCSTCTLYTQSQFEPRANLGGKFKNATL